MKIENKITSDEADKMLYGRIEEAKTNHDLACDLYREYVGSAETREERLRRIHLFRCGGGMM